MDNQTSSNKQTTDNSPREKSVEDCSSDKNLKDKKDNKQNLSHSNNEINLNNFLTFKSESTPDNTKSISKFNNESTMNTISKILSPIKSNRFAKGQCIYKGELCEIFSGLSLETGEIIAMKTINLNYTNEIQRYEKYSMVDKLLNLKHKNLINIMTIQETGTPNSKSLV
jgi:hypothetical protein